MTIYFRPARCRAAVCALALLVMTGHAEMQRAGALPGMPPLVDPRDVYAAARPGNLSQVVSGFPQRVYVPNSGSDTVDVIDPQTFKVIDHFAVGKQPQDVVPSDDLKTLLGLKDHGN